MKSFFSKDKFNNNNNLKYPLWNSTLKKKKKHVSALIKILYEYIVSKCLVYVLLTNNINTSGIKKKNKSKNTVKNQRKVLSYSIKKY